MSKEIRQAEPYGDQGVDIPTLNSFCRRYNMIFVEMGLVKGEDVYCFIDFKNGRAHFTADEIESKLIT